MLELSKAIELVTKLERTRNFPRDPEGIGVENLARGLQKASDALNIGGARIVERCAEASEYCPTDADLFTVAREISRLDALSAGTFDSLSKASNVARPIAAKHRCSLCNDTGWRIVYMLHTRDGGSTRSYVRKERITEEVARELAGKIDPQKQTIYSGAKRCACPVQQDYAQRAAGDGE